ncbi:MAG: hypothetical protein RJA07_1881 [Bacteroidota bacterium]|jgi:hypothetical protein
MSHSNHTSESNKPTNYLFRIALAFVFVISIACLLRIVIGRQQCAHCSICATCQKCEEDKIENIEQQQLWGAETGKGECEGCNEGEEKACCKKKDKCEQENDKAETKNEESEEHANEKNEETANHK